MHCLEIVEDVRLAEYTSEHIASLLADGSTEPVGSQLSSKRQRRLPGYLTNSVVTTRLPQYRDSDTISEFRALIVDIIEGFKSELNGRFSSINVGIWDSFQSLSLQFDKDKFLYQQRLDKLLVYAMDVPALKSPYGEGRLGDDVTEARHDLKAECRIYKRSLLSAFESIPPELRPLATEKLLGQCQARPPMRILNNLFKVAAVADYSVRFFGQKSYRHSV